MRSRTSWVRRHGHLGGFALAALFTIVAAAAALAGCSSGEGDPEPVAEIVYEANGDGGTNVYTLNPETGASRQITFGTGFDGNPAWSPDDKRIVFVSNRESEQADIYVMDADGANPVRLTDTPGREVAPKFSPDGTQIAYSRQDESDWALWVMDADGSDQKQLAGPYKFVEFPSWRPGRNEIFFSAIAAGGGAADIFGIDLDTGTVVPRIATDASDVCPHFSHDGRWLTYATDAGDPGEIDVFRHDLTSSATGGSEDERLTDAPGTDDYANYSPDDRELVFVARRNGQSDLYLMDADGTNQRPLTETPALQENVPDW